MVRPDLWYVQEKLPLPRDRARMSEAEQRERIGMVARTARARGEILERARIEEETSVKNMSNIDEIVFGRDMDGSGDVGIGPGDVEQVSRKFCQFDGNANKRSEVAEAAFNKPKQTLVMSEHERQVIARSHAHRRAYAEPVQPAHRSVVDFLTTGGSDGTCPFDPTRGRDRSLDDWDRSPRKDLLRARRALEAPPGIQDFLSPRVEDLRARGLRGQGVGIGGYNGTVGDVVPDLAMVNGRIINKTTLGVQPEPSPGSVRRTVSHLPYFTGTNVAPEPPIPPGYFIALDGYGLKQFEPTHNRRSLSAIARDGMLTDSPRLPTPTHNPYAGVRNKEAGSHEHGVLLEPPPGYIVMDDGSFRAMGEFAGRSAHSIVGEEIAWRPETNAALNSAAHAQLRRDHTYNTQALDSKVDDIVFPSAADARTNTMAQDGLYSANSNAFSFSSASAKARVERPPGAGPRIEEVLEYATTRREVPSELTSTGKGGARPVYTDRHDLLYYDNEHVGRSPRPVVPFLSQVFENAFNNGRSRDLRRDELPRTDMRGQIIPDGHLASPRKAENMLSPDRIKDLPRKPRGTLDAYGRAEASSVVDETVFNKAPVGGMLHMTNVLANFTIDRSGEFANR